MSKWRDVRVAVLAVPVLFVAFGAAHAGDADTITFDNKTFRLDGIDAPEIDQTCLDVEGAFQRLRPDGGQVIHAALEGDFHASSTPIR
jgi:hypothetical protein